MPVIAGEIDGSALGGIIRMMTPAFAVVERFASRPTDSRPAACAFGGAYHATRLVLALEHVPTHLVAPQTWMRHHRLTGAEDPKEAARGLTRRLFPVGPASFSRKKDYHRADAALLALFAAATIDERDY